MTYLQFSELEPGATITMEQFKQIFADVSYVTVKDNSVRGAKTVSTSDVSVGDLINNGTRFITIVEDEIVEDAIVEDTTMTNLSDTVRAEMAATGKTMFEAIADHMYDDCTADEIAAINEMHSTRDKASAHGITLLAKGRHYYAGHSYMGVCMTFDSSCWTAYVFDTEQERDAWVAAHEYGNGNIVAQAIEARIARKIAGITQWQEACVDEHDQLVGGYLRGGQLEKT